MKFLNAYLYDLQLGLIENGTSRMIVSTAFQVHVRIELHQVIVQNDTFQTIT
jgi:hypothetical protein